MSRAAFMRAGPESAKKLLDLTVFFALLGSACIKAACKMMVKLTLALYLISIEIELSNGFAIQSKYLFVITSSSTSFPLSRFKWKFF